MLHPAEQLCAIEKVVREEESENSWVKKLQKIVQRGLLPPIGKLSKASWVVRGWVHLVEAS